MYEVWRSSWSVMHEVRDDRMTIASVLLQSWGWASRGLGMVEQKVKWRLTGNLFFSLLGVAFWLAGGACWIWGLERKMKGRKRISLGSTVDEDKKARKGTEYPPLQIWGWDWGPGSGGKEEGLKIYSLPICISGSSGLWVSSGWLLEMERRILARIFTKNGSGYWRLW